MTTLRTKIEELCAASPKTSKELAALLDEDPTMVTQACYRLRNRGRLTGTKRGREIVNSLPSVDERLGFFIAVLALERMADYLMEYTRTHAENALSEAQTVRTHERQRWADLIVDMVADLVSNGATVERVKEWKTLFAEENRAYTRVLSSTDLALVNRVTEIVSNEQRARVEGDDKLQQQMDGQ